MRQRPIIHRDREALWFAVPATSVDRKVQEAHFRKPAVDGFIRAVVGTLCNDHFGVHRLSLGV